MHGDMAIWFLDGVPLDWAAFLMRWVIGLTLLPYGIRKFRNPESADHFFKVFFLSPKIAYYLAAFVETSVSCCLILGIFTRFAAIAGLVNMAVAASKSWNKNFTSPALVFLLGMFAVLCTGPGRISLDWLFLG